MDTADTSVLSFLTSPKGLTLVVSIVAVALAIYILLSTQATKFGLQPPVTPTPISQNEAQSNQTTPHYQKVNPSVITSTLSFQKETNSVDILLDTGSVDVSGAEITIAYNPKALTNVSVSNGTFFDNPLVLQNSVDTIKGIIHYTVSIQPNYAQQYGQGILATIHYSIAPGNTTTLSFTPETKITQLGTNGSVLKKATPVTLP